MSQKENQAIGDINGSITGKYEERSHFLFLGALGVEFRALDIREFRALYIREITGCSLSSIVFFLLNSELLSIAWRTPETALES